MKTVRCAALHAFSSCWAVWRARRLACSCDLSSESVLAYGVGLFTGLLQTALVHPNEARSPRPASAQPVRSLTTGLTAIAATSQHIALRCACAPASRRLGWCSARRLINGMWLLVAPASVSLCQDAERLTPCDRLNTEIRPAQRPSPAPHLPGRKLLPCRASVCSGQHAARLLNGMASVSVWAQPACRDHLGSSARTPVMSAAQVALSGRPTNAARFRVKLLFSPTSLYSCASC